MNEMLSSELLILVLPVGSLLVLGAVALHGVSRHGRAEFLEAVGMAPDRSTLGEIEPLVGSSIAAARPVRSTTPPAPTPKPTPIATAAGTRSGIPEAAPQEPAPAYS